MSFKAGLEIKTDFEVTCNRDRVSSILCQCLSACFLVHIGEPDQSTHDAGSASAKPTSAPQSPDSAQPLAPASGDQADPTMNCSSGHQQPNISSPNKVMAPSGKVGTSQVNSAAIPHARGVCGSSCCFCVRERENLPAK